MRTFSTIRSSTLLGLMAALALVGCNDNPYCGDGQCQISSGENAMTCPQDCPAACGDGFCTGSETHAGCARDCMADCGDGTCDSNETFQSCPADCPPPPVCGDGVCDSGETHANCPADCPLPAVCGNGICENGETASNCPADCYVAYCGNGVCDFGETEYNCFADCNDHCSVGQVDCFADDYCWPGGTNCSGNLFSCGGGPWRCASNADWANCCNNTFITCGPGFPYYCPANNTCYSTPQGCSVASCTFVDADCGP